MPEEFQRIADDYRRLFIPPYAEYVALTAEIPMQILIENGNIMSHLFQAYNPELTPRVRDENFAKAESHLIRASMDLHKLIWVEILGRLNAVMKDPIRRLCFALPDEEVIIRFKSFKGKGGDARRHELENVGSELQTTLEKYNEANEIGKSLYDTLDVNKLDTISFWTRIYGFKHIVISSIISFILGIGASFLGTILYNLYANTPK